MRVIIFGCGYVGRNLAPAFIEEGHEVWIHSRNPASLESVVSVPPEHRVAGNLHDEDWHPALEGDWDVAFNLVSSAGGGIDGYRISYLEGNRSIQKWARARTVGRFIYTSATSVYPQSDGRWVTEEDVPDVAELSASGRILREAEMEILQSGVFERTAIARLAGIYGPGRHLYLNSLQEGLPELPGDGSAWLNLIYLKDIVSALNLLALTDKLGSSEILNVVDDVPARKQAIVDWLAGELGKPTISFNKEFQGSRAKRRTTSTGLPNRRVSIAQFKALCHWQPGFPSYREGYADILGKA
jgi:nucleoside-diphosphate-sugar epimerase